MSPPLSDRIKYIDSVETDTHVYIATERVRPLQGVLRDWMSGGALTGGQGKGKGKEDWIGWGVKSISVSLRISEWAGPTLIHRLHLPF